MPENEIPLLSRGILGKYYTDSDILIKIYKNQEFFTTSSSSRGVLMR